MTKPDFDSAKRAALRILSSVEPDADGGDRTPFSDCKDCGGSGLVRGDKGRVYTCQCFRRRLSKQRRADVPGGGPAVPFDTQEQVRRWVPNAGSRALVIMGESGPTSRPMTESVARMAADLLSECGASSRYCDMEDVAPVRVSDFEAFARWEDARRTVLRADVLILSAWFLRWEQVTALAKLLKTVRAYDNKRVIILCGALTGEGSDDAKWDRVTAELSSIGAEGVRV